MAKAPKKILSAFDSLLPKIGLELSIIEPGSDAGLLPLNSFIYELSDLIALPAVPEPFREAAAFARACIDRLLDTTARFDEPTIATLFEWQVWLETAVGDWKAGHAIAAPQFADAVNAAVVESRTTPEPVPAAESAEPPLTLNLEADRELLAEFINESNEHLQNIEQGVLVLEENPVDADTLNSIFRAFHTFKGGAGFLNLTPIKDLAHELESLLDAARTHRLAVTTPVIDVILAGGDTLTSFVTQISTQLAGRSTGAIVIPTRALIRRVQAVLANPDAPAESPAPPTAASGEDVAKIVPMSAAVPPPERGGEHSTSTAVKVDTHKLDSLIEIVGELVIAQSMVVQDPAVRGVATQGLTRAFAQLRRITNELQRTAMSLRMVPIRSTFQKMTRLVRDLAARQEKQVKLVMNGEDTELDRNIVGALADPLVHMIRNSVDHGIETPEARVARGKPPEGTVELSAFHQGGSIVIQIRDDGNGLNKNRILAKAVEKGIIRADASLPDHEIFDLIFAPGFSTAENVTDISGRGVGMDVVRRNIESLRGKIVIDSAVGQGTTFTIYLPLTLAIIDGMLVGVGTERYIIPTLSVRESFRPKPEMISTVCERGEMVNVRGRLTPLLRLYQHFGVASNVTDPTEGIVVVVESGPHTRCIMVDELIGKQEVVIKSLGEQFKQNRALAGGAIMGDGRVGLIVNVDALVKLGPIAA
ncbi:MAG: chemotaxis protein CheA [Chthoniobacteraceae bacterium]